MKKSTVIELICFSLVVLFVYAGMSKLLDFEKFKVELGKSALLDAFASFVAWFVPTIEIVISILLIIPRYRLKGLYLSFFLMVLFTEYIIAILQFSENIPCSCGGVLQNMTWEQHLIFNIGVTLLTLTAVLLSPSKEPSTASVNQPA